MQFGWTNERLITKPRPALRKLYVCPGVAQLVDDDPLALLRLLFGVGLVRAGQAPALEGDIAYEQHA